MEANRESLLSTTGSLFCSQESSILLSEYLQHYHAQKAGKRLIHPSTPLIVSPSKRMFTASIHREEAEASQAPRFSSLKETSSSANSVPGPSFTTVKESSGSFIAQECSSQTLCELDYDRGDSGFIHRTTLSSFSCIESIECDESITQATTKIHTSSGSLNLGRLNCESVKGNVLADDDGKLCSSNRQLLDNMVRVNPKFFAKSKQASHLAGLSKISRHSECDVSPNSMTGFDLLVNAAMQVEFLDNQDFHISKATFAHATKGDSAGHFNIRYACPVELNSPILKKRVIRRARNAFSKQTGKDVLHGLSINSPARLTTKKPGIAAKKDDNGINMLKATHMQQHENTIQYVRRKSLKTLPAVASSNAIVLNIGSRNGSKQGDVAMAAIGKQNLKGVSLKERSCRLKQQKNMYSSTSAELVHPAQDIAAKLKFDANYQDSVSRERAASTSDRADCGSKETNCEASAEIVSCIKFGGSGIKVKFGPLNSPSKSQLKAQEFAGIEQDRVGSQITRISERLCISELAEALNTTTISTEGLMSYSSDQKHILAEDCTWLIGSSIVSSQESSKLETPECVPESKLIKHKSEQLLFDSHPGERNSTMKLIEVMHCESFNRPGQSSPLIRSKRGRSQVLPSKFSDSVLQPWKRAYRKKS
ncbi:hypothetical protein L7F22_004718 [Adiantum nelumboides]|nr:hypothetical protein [Adiantum nelumboides]